MTDPFLLDQPVPDVVAGRRRLPLLVGGGVLAALLVGGGAYLVASGGDTDLDSGTTAASAPRTAATPTPTPEAPVPGAVPAVDVSTGVNPFRALYTEPASSEGSAGASPSAASPAPAASSTSPAPKTSSSPTATPSASASPSRTAATGRYPLQLVSVGELGLAGRPTVFLVDGVHTEVVGPQPFGRDGELVVVSYIQQAGGGEVVSVEIEVDGSSRLIDIGETIQVP